MKPRIYSVGYEGYDVKGMADHLAAIGVSVLVDVRLNAISRRPGFSKKALSAALAAVGIEYIHERELGNPQDNRDAFRRGDGLEGRRRMRAILSNGSHTALERLVGLARHSRVAVMCVEREHDRCHRDVITSMAQEMDPTIEIRQVL